MQKIEWMVAEAANDELNLTAEDITYILASGGGSVFSPSEVDYILELGDEWEQEHASR